MGSNKIVSFQGKRDIEQGDTAVFRRDSKTKSFANLSKGATSSINTESRAESMDCNVNQNEENVIVSTKFCPYHVNRKHLFAILVITLGAAVCAVFLLLGIHSANTEQQQAFEKQASDFIIAIEESFRDYQTAALWIHEACRSTKYQSDHSLPRGICNRNDYAELYEYITSTGLEFVAMSWTPNVTDAERPALENETRTWLAANYPDERYNGFIGLQRNADGTYSIQPRDHVPWYWVAHIIEPALSPAQDFDLYTSKVRRDAINDAVETYLPAITDRFKMLVDTDKDPYSIKVIHPGVRLAGSDPQEKPQAVAVIVIKVPDLLLRALRGQQESMSAYLYDQPTDSLLPPVYFGGAEVFVSNNYTETKYLVEEVDIKTLTSKVGNHRQGVKVLEKSVHIMNKNWRIVVVSNSCTYNPSYAYVIVAATIVFVACLSLAAWIFTHMSRESKLNEIRAVAEAEKAALIIQNAERATIAERELNDFIAHEVRNPLAAAISAHSFVATEINEPVPLKDEDTRITIREDVGIIGSSLQYVNELLRNMLDMHKAASKQINIEMGPTDILRDVLEPVATLLYRRGDNFKVEVECPSDLVIMADRMRLKQIVLNLAGNSRKFVQKGFIRLRATVTSQQTVELSVEDSGPGIPQEKRSKLFDKFQESLDSLNQGTGVGLCLCKNLAQLMEGDLHLDESYNSGAADYPGSRFVVALNKSPLKLDCRNTSLSVKNDVILAADIQQKESALIENFDDRELPENLVVLFVDDDTVLRKLFTRSVQKVAPTWGIHEASNGETALRMVETKAFDLIFMDQYMASVEKQLLGTETVRLLRSTGVEAIICGLSANNSEELFINAGADAFMIKPFPCEVVALSRELKRILHRSTLPVTQNETM